MKSCPNCGAVAEDATKYCSECGYSLQAVISSRKEKVNLHSDYTSNQIESNAKSNMRHEKNKSRKEKSSLRWIFIVFAVLIVAIFGFLAYKSFGDGTYSKNSITPYGVQWGDSPEIVMKKDKNAVRGGVNKNAELTYRDDKIFGRFFNLKDDTIKSPILLYRFIGNKLTGITYVCSINTDVISSDEFIDGIIAFFFFFFKKEPEFQSIKYVWSSEEGTVTVCYMTDELFFIEYYP